MIHSFQMVLFNPRKLKIDEKNLILHFLRKHFIIPWLPCNLTCCLYSTCLGGVRFWGLMSSDRYSVSHRCPAVQPGSQIRLHKGILTVSHIQIGSCSSSPVCKLVSEAQGGQIQAWDLWMCCLSSGQKLWNLELLSRVNRPWELGFRKILTARAPGSLRNLGIEVLLYIGSLITGAFNFWVSVEVVCWSSLVRATTWVTARRLYSNSAQMHGKGGLDSFCLWQGCLRNRVYTVEINEYNGGGF